MRPRQTSIEMPTLDTVASVDINCPSAVATLKSSPCSKKYGLEDLDPTPEKSKSDLIRDKLVAVSFATRIRD